MPSIHPVHFSIRKGRPKKPRAMDRIMLDCDVHAGLSGVALSIFVDSVNSGVTFQDALLSVYLSGLQHGSSSQKEVTSRYEETS